MTTPTPQPSGFDITTVPGGDWLAAAAQAGPGSAVSAPTAAAPQPIGIPSDYGVFGHRTTVGVDEGMPGRGPTQLPTQTTVYGVQPVTPYFDGAELLPATEGWDPAKIAVYQKRLADAGLLDGYHKGVWDKGSQAAFYQILAYANQNGLSYDEALDRYSKQSAEAGGLTGGATRAPLTTALANPDELKAVLSTVSTALGVQITDQDASRFIRSYHQLQAEKQRADYNMAVTGGTEVAGPSAQTFAENQLRNAHPVEATSHDVAGVFDQFLHLIGGQ